MLDDFQLKDVCRGHPHCQLCRSLEDGRQFREHMVALIKVDKPKIVDFECPDGIPWDFQDKRDIKDRLRLPHREYDDVKISNFVIERFEICKKCEHSREKGHKCEFYKGCCFGRWRSDPKHICPATPPKWNFTNALP